MHGNRKTTFIKGILHVKQNMQRKITQFVSINNVKSNLLNISYGVLQNAIFGPQLFLIYINDLCSVSYIAKLSMFAHDTN